MTFTLTPLDILVIIMIIVAVNMIIETILDWRSRPKPKDQFIDGLREEVLEGDLTLTGAFEAIKDEVVGKHRARR